MTYTDVDAIGTKQDPAYGFGRDQDTNSKSSGNPNSPFTASDDSSHSDTGPAGGSNRSGFGVDRYEELDLPLYATQEEIKSQYKRLVRVHHPDRF
ncbi:MAG: J domain-containing protein [Caldilineaceae bacterium]